MKDSLACNSLSTRMPSVLYCRASTPLSSCWPAGAASSGTGETDASRHCYWFLFHSVFSLLIVLLHLRPLAR